MTITRKKKNEYTNNLRKNLIKITAPLITLSKEEIVKLGIDNNIKFEETWTCYEGGEKACGYCTACSSRIQGFLQNKIADPIEYGRNDIPWERA